MDGQERAQSPWSGVPPAAVGTGGTPEQGGSWGEGGRRGVALAEGWGGRLCDKKVVAGGDGRSRREGYFLFPELHVGGETSL